MKGQFFTITNPFLHDLFYKWSDTIPNFKSKEILEPFAGCNNIVDMIDGIGFNNNWKCFDIDPECKILTEDSKFQVETRDTLNNFPTEYEVVITNPPYLAKNSATRSGLSFPDSKYDDLYKIAVDKMLLHSKYIAAIIPESFITQELFHNRLYGVVSLTMRMFEDTDCPVCLALFVPEENKKNIDDFLIYSGDRKVGTYLEMQRHLKNPSKKLNYVFNDPKGVIGLYAIDDSKTDSIKFVKGETIDSKSIKDSSRSITRISIPDNNINIDALIERANSILSEHRKNTSDLFLTPFKGLRKDGKYRRRLDFKNAKRILNLAYMEITND